MSLLRELNRLKALRPLDDALAHSLRRLDPDTHDDVLRIPTSALREGNHVLIEHNGVLVERNVRTGLSNWEQTEVLEGLSAGDRIVTSLERAGVEAGAQVSIEASTQAATP